MSRKTVKSLLIVMVAVALMTTASLAVPPHPDAIKQFKEQGVWEQKVAQLRANDSATAARINERLALTGNRMATRMEALSEDAVDTMRMLVILVDFPDFRYDAPIYNTPSGGQIVSAVAGTPESFDSLLFSQRGIDAKYNPAGSLTEFYLETSHGKLLIIGDVFGWYTMEHDYSWYVGNDDGLGAGGGRLALHAVRAAQAAGVNFAPYANGSYQVPGFSVVHAGPGAETGAYGIWSHQGNMDSSVIANGVMLYPYAMDPEEMQPTLSSMGVFAHEWGHVLGLPDWYDVSYQGSGIGDFSLMSGGSWNNNGRSPALLDGYSRYWLGFTPGNQIAANTKNVPLAQIETGGPVYLLHWPAADHGMEFWLVENRQRTGLFDSYLPGEGLLIYHYDGAGSQSNPARYRLAVEQADGLEQLEAGAGGGDAADPWPGTTNNRNFWDFSTPNAHFNSDDAVSQIGVLDITPSDSVMYAELAVTYGKPWVVLTDDSVVMTDNAPGGDGDGLLEQGETINMVVTVKNVGRQGYKPRCVVSVDEPGVTFTQNNVYVGNGLSLNPGVTYETYPIIFTIPTDQWATNATFTISIISDSTNHSGDRSFVNTITYRKQIGVSQILLVDDDNNRSDESGYLTAFGDLGILYDTWDKYDSASPPYETLSEYNAVLWMQGSNTNGGTLDAEDVVAMKAYLDGGGNLCLASSRAVTQLKTLDSNFLRDYFHVGIPGGAKADRNFLGLADNQIGDNLRYRSSATSSIDSLTALGAAKPAFRCTPTDTTIHNGVCGVTYEGAYRTIFLSFAIEFLKDDVQSAGFSPKSELVSRIIDFLALGGHTAVDDPTDPTLLPEGFTLAQNYPNPFNPSTIIEYTVNPGELTVTNLSVFNVLGRKVATLVDAIQGPGTYQVEWDGRSSDGSRAATGVYMYRLTRGDRIEAKKMLLLK